jgi:penicillin amidase
MRITDMINEKLDAGKRLSVADMHTFQMDTYSIPAEQIQPYALIIKPENDAQAKAFDHLKNWDFRFETHQVGASVYETWYQFMVKNTFSDELLKNKVWGFQTPQKAVMALGEILPDANNIWFDDVTTAQHETRDDIVRRSFTDAMDWLSKNYGADPNRWEWGNMHKVSIAHGAFAGIPVLGQLFGSSAYPFPGSDFSVNLAYSSYFAYGEASTNYNVLVAAQQRQIIDLSNWDSMLAVNSGGQNGNLFHPQREDQTPLWVAGEYYTVPFSQQAAEKNATDTLILNPIK